MWKYGCEELCACGSMAVRSFVMETSSLKMSSTL